MAGPEKRAKLLEYLEHWYAGRVEKESWKLLGYASAAQRAAAAMRRTSSKIPPVLSSFPSLFRLQRWTELNHSSAGGRRGSGGLAMHGVMRVLIARWLR